MLFRFIGGLGIGASSVLGPVYIAELAPAKWRGRLVSAFQLNVVFGILVAYTSNYLIRLMHLGATEWRWQVGIAAIPAVAFSGAALQHSPQPALVRRQESQRRGP
jgi:SP family arabinose:H+ symporter-like MFS transporter